MAATRARNPALRVHMLAKLVGMKVSHMETLEMSLAMGRLQAEVALALSGMSPLINRAAIQVASSWEIRRILQCSCLAWCPYMARYTGPSNRYVPIWWNERWRTSVGSDYGDC